MPATATLSITLGDDAVIPIAFNNPDGTDFDLTNGSADFAMETTPGSAALSKTTANGGIVVTNALTGLANLVINSADTVALKAGARMFAYRGTNAAGKKSHQVIGTIFLNPSPLV